MSEETAAFVARPTDITALKERWTQARGGMPQTVRLQAPFGGGRRALANAFLRDVQADDEEAILWRVNCIDQENGLQWLVRMYGSLVATLTTDVLRRGKIEMMLNAQLPQQPKRVQTWYQQFIAGLKESQTDRDTGQVQLRIPQDNPLIGLVEIVHAIARKIPLILEIQHPYAVNSLTLAMFVEALHCEARDGSSMLLTVLYDEPPSDITEAVYPRPLLDLYARRGDEMTTQAIEPWGATEVEAYLASKGQTGNAARIAEIANGRPGFVAEVIDILTEQGVIDGDLEGVDLASLVPSAIDEEELEVPESPSADSERKHATADDAGRISYLAALLGSAFPSNLVADMGGFERDSVDDLFDAMGNLFEEVQFSQELQTWIYRFKRGSWRDGILARNDTEEGHDLARRVGLFMERYLVPRGYGFIVKTARVYAEHEALGRADMMRSLALTNDHADTWGLAFDFTKYFDELKWPEPLLRTIYMNLMDRLVAAGNLQVAERVHSEITEWATKNEDREMTAWLLWSGSKLDARRQDLFRARDRANDALKLYEALEDNGRRAEIHNHLAQVELQDGNPNAALEQVEKAVELGKVESPDGQTGVIPGVYATAELIRGLVKRRGGDPTAAAEHFKRANEVAGQAGIAQLALESGLSYGESLMASGQVKQARDVLERVLQIARALRNGVRERNAAEILAQAEGALRNYDKALPLAQRVLELTTALKFEQALPIDQYNLGFFHFMNKNPTEALSFFNQANDRVSGLGPNHPVVKELHYFKGLAHIQVGQLDLAKTSLKAGLRPAQDAKDWRKMCSALENLANIEQQQGNTGVAKKLLADAVGFAQQGNLKEERKNLRKKLDSLGA